MLKTGLKTSLYDNYLTGSYGYLDYLTDGDTNLLDELPICEVKENEVHYEINMIAPGYSKEDFNISVHNGILTISKRPINNLNKGDRHSELGGSSHHLLSFARSFGLPVNINLESMQGIYDNGVLTILIDKKEIRLKEMPTKEAVH